MTIETTQPPNEHKVVSVKEAAAMLGVGRKRIMTAINLGQLKGSKLGGWWAISWWSIERFRTVRSTREHNG
jgi:hypothetical protein